VAYCASSGDRICIEEPDGESGSEKADEVCESDVD
jgi:hypothetical protein